VESKVAGSDLASWTPEALEKGWPVTQAWVLGFDIGRHSLDDSVRVHTHDMITAFPEDTVAVIVAEGRIPLAAAGALESYWCKIPSSKQEQQQQKPTSRPQAVPESPESAHVAPGCSHRSMPSCLSELALTSRKPTNEK